MFSLQNLHFIFLFGHNHSFWGGRQIYSTRTEILFSKVRYFQTWKTTVLFQDISESSKPKKTLKLCIKSDTSKLLKNMGKWKLCTCISLLKPTKDFLVALALLFSLPAHNHKFQVFCKEYFLIVYQRFCPSDWKFTAFPWPFWEGWGVQGSQNLYKSKPAFDVSVRPWFSGHIIHLFFTLSESILSVS